SDSSTVTLERPSSVAICRSPKSRCWPRKRSISGAGGLPERPVVFAAPLMPVPAEAGDGRVCGKFRADVISKPRFCRIFYLHQKRGLGKPFRNFIRYRFLWKLL